MLIATSLLNTAVAWNSKISLALTPYEECRFSSSVSTICRRNEMMAMLWVGINFSVSILVVNSGLVNTNTNPVVGNRFITQG